MGAPVASPQLPDVEPVRFVAPDGAPVGRGAADAPIAADRLVWLYETMVVTRELDEEFVNLQRQGQLAQPMGHLGAVGGSDAGTVDRAPGDRLRDAWGSGRRQ
jgi:hypothetical protein